MKEKKTLVEILHAIQTRAIKKDQRNEFGKFNFFNINQLKALVNEEFSGSDYVCLPEKKTEIINEKGEITDFVKIRVFDKDMKCVVDSGWSSIPQDTLKGMNKFQMFGSGESYIGKYLYSNFFGLSTDAKDPDEGDLIETKPTYQKATPKKTIKPKEKLEEVFDDDDFEF